MKTGTIILNTFVSLVLVFGLISFLTPTVNAAPCECCGCSSASAGSCGSGWSKSSASKSCGDEGGKSIVDIAAGSDSFDTLVAAVKAAGLVDTLSGKGPFTVFAPTDEAFARIPKEDLAALLKPENKDKLTAILTYHVVPGKVKASEVVRLSAAKTANGQKVSIRTSKGNVFVDNAKVVKTDIDARNGVIHVIDTVIMPDFRKDIVDTAVAAGSFNTLVAAVKAAGLVDVLKGEGPFTVFAPSDEAFDRLPKGTVQELLKPENKDKLTAILTYHVVSGKVNSDHVARSLSAKTVNGQAVGFAVREKNVYVDDAKVVKVDIPASNGVIHVIDTVLIPQ